MFRCNGHNYKIKVARFSKQPLYEITSCTFCNLTEDEYHVLLECPQYSDLRNKYLPLYLCRQPTREKFIAVLTTNDVRLLYKLSLFMYHVHRQRKLNYNDAN